MMRKPSAAAVASCAVLLGLGIAAHAQAVGELAKTGNWRIFTNISGAPEICFAATQPADTQPKGANRGPIYFYVTTWPKDGVRAEISVKFGFNVKKDATPTLTIGADAFPLFAQGERAYIGDPNSELKAIDAIRKGSLMTVQAVSERGTAVIDTYSLAGVSQALQKLAAACP